MTNRRRNQPPPTREALAAAVVASAAGRALQQRLQAAMTPAPRTPSPGPESTIRNLRVVPGQVHVIGYEGQAVLTLSRLTARFANLCISPSGLGVDPGFVRKQFRLQTPGQRGQASPKSVFTLVAVKNVVSSGDNIVVGFAQCTMYSTLAGVATPRVVKLDLLCSQGDNPTDRLKGAASVLMDELEKFARRFLGANLLALDSVKDRSTWEFYKARGFVRSPDACSAFDAEEARRQLARARGPLGLDRHPEYLEATQGVYFPGMNMYYTNAAGRIVPDTVVMTKCLTDKKGTNRLGVVYAEPRSNSLAPGAPAPSVLAHFPQADGEGGVGLLAVYNPGIPLQRVRGVAADTAPLDPFRPRAEGSRTTRRTRKNSSV
jgi:hypothetical protein